MKIFADRNNVLDAADAVVKHGVVCIEGTKTSAVAYCNRVIAALVSYDDIELSIGYQNVPNSGHLYYVYDLQRYEIGSTELKSIIQKLDSNVSI